MENQGENAQKMAEARGCGSLPLQERPGFFRNKPKLRFFETCQIKKYESKLSIF